MDILIERSLASTVQIFSERSGGARRAASGVVVRVDDHRSLVITAAHVVEPKVEQVISVVPARTGTRHSGRVLYSDSTNDVAVIETDPLNVPQVDVQVNGHLGQTLWVIAFPLGKRATIVSGIVSQIGGEWDDGPVPMRGPIAMIDAPVSYGSSGGAIFSAADGRLVGIVRGYNTARIPIPGATAVNLPLSGETTTVAARHILCALLVADPGSSPPETAPCTNEERVAGTP